MNKKTLPTEHKHRKPVSRRDFLAMGALTSSAFIVSSHKLFPGVDYLRCGEDSSNLGTIPFLVFDMAGGAALPGSFLVGKQNGPEDFLKSYDLLGWNPRSSGIDRRFGLPMASQVGGFFQGMSGSISAEAQAKFRMASICHRAQDDSPLNPLSAIGLVARSGYSGGEILQKAVGTADTLSGGNSKAVFEEAKFKPILANNLTALLNAISFPAMLDLAAGSVGVTNAAVQSLGRAQGKMFSDTYSAEILEQLGECFLGRLKVTSGTNDIDPRLNPVFQKIYGLSPTSSPLDQNSVFAAIVYNVLRHKTGPGVITLGDCDYHTGDNVKGDQRDITMGRHIGLAVQAAHELKTPLFFQLITDGGCSSDSGTRNWRSDSGEKCMTVMGYYDPRSAPTQRRLQVGNYTDGQGAAQDTIVGSNPAKATHTVFANYLNIQGRINEYERIAAGDLGIPSTSLDSVLVFDKVI